VRAAVLGRPIAHSLSPALHRAAYSALGLDWTYDAVDVGSDDLAGFLAGLGPEWAGLSLTMPLKQSVLPLLDTCSPLGTAVGAANTVVLRGGARAGHNTDVHGIVAALQEAGVAKVSSAAVVGGGATAASALAALAELGCFRPSVLVRTPARTGPLLEAAGRLGISPSVEVLPSVLPAVDVVVSSVPAGAADALRPPRSPGVLLDVVYDPWPTRLAAAWSAAGGAVVDGVAMLLHQAAAQVELMTLSAAPLAAMRAALPAR
jgi:shikimate dehydrogenase